MYARPLETSNFTMTRVGDDAALIALCAELDEAARLAKQHLGSMPDYPGAREETAAIEAILQPGEKIADRMMGLPAVTPEGTEARLRAEVWKRGEYIAAYLAVE